MLTTVFDIKHFDYDKPVSLTYTQGGNTQTDTWSAYATVGYLRINFTNNVNYYSGISSAHSFRYVIIPGVLPLPPLYAMPW